MQSVSETAVVAVKKSPVMIRREMIADPAVMGALDPVERAVFLASSAKTVAEYDPKELAVELRTALTWISKDVGIRTTDESERQYIVIRTVELLKRYYSNLSLKDFRMAFEMSITGKLDDYLPRGRDGRADRGHYQQFNAEYICKILDAYAARRGAILKKAFDAVKKNEDKPVDDEQKEHYRKEAIKHLYEAFDDFRDTGRLDTSAVSELVFYNILSEYGLAVPINVTPEDQKAVWQRAVNDYARKGMIGDVKDLEKNGVGDPRLEHGAYVLARHKALLKVFNDFVKDGVSIREKIHI